jgi:hypothetical protein
LGRLDSLWALISSISEYVAKFYKTHAQRIKIAQVEKEQDGCRIKQNTTVALVGYYDV